MVVGAQHAGPLRLILPARRGIAGPKRQISVKTIEETVDTTANSNVYGAVDESWIRDEEGYRVDVSEGGWPEAGSVTHCTWSVEPRTLSRPVTPFYFMGLRLGDLFTNSESDEVLRKAAHLLTLVIPVQAGIQARLSSPSSWYALSLRQSA